MYFNKMIEYNSITFRVKGEYEEARPAWVTADPYYSRAPEGGAFERFDVYTCEGEQIDDLLKDDVVCDLMDTVKNLLEGTDIDPSLG